MPADGLNLFVADTYNHLIRQIVISTGAVTTLAGSAGVSGSTDDVGAAARFYHPYDLTVSADGLNLFVADRNHLIRQIVISTGTVTTLASSAGVSGSTDDVGTVARFNRPAAARPGHVGRRAGPLRGGFQ